VLGPTHQLPGSTILSVYNKRLYDLIRTELQIAAEQERRIGPFNLYGRGHESRITVNVRLAGVLRGSKIPSVYLPGFGPKTHYPYRVFKRAHQALARTLGRSPLSWYFNLVRLDVVGPPRIPPPRLIRLSSRQTPKELQRRGWTPTPVGYERKLGRRRVYFSRSIDKPTRHFLVSVSPLVNLDEVLAMRKSELERLKKRSRSVSDN